MVDVEAHKIWYKKLLFLVQISTLLAMIIISIINIIYKTGNLPLWTALLGTSLGYILPAPRFKVAKTEGIVPSGPSSVVT